MKPINIVFLAFLLWRCEPSLTKAEENPVPVDKPKTENVTLLSSKLPSVVEEQSGMVWYNNLIWVINDSGCLPELYAYDRKGELKRRVKVADADNVDWEALAADENNFYIGDFGNNRGTRKDLKVLKISKSQIDNTALKNVKAEAINFKWSDQTDFSSRNCKHNYDCESLFAFDNKLYLFSKNWLNKKTRIYRLTTTAGNYVIKPLATVNTNFMVTGADVSSDGKVVALVGYKSFKTYMYFFYDYKNFDFTKGRNKRVCLKTLGAAQTEGVVFDKDDTLYISTESFKGQKPSLYQVYWKSILGIAE